MAENIIISPNFSLSLFLALFLSAAHLFLPLLGSPDPVPAPWPPQFHSILIINSTKGALQVTDLWYDYPNGRNFNIIQKQLGEKLYDLEWDNGTSYYYTLDDNRECTVRHFPVGILRPNWLEGANYLGRVRKDEFLCDVWEKVDFITYYEDVATKRPVFWAFFSGLTTHVMTFEVGKVLEDPNWQAPTYCFLEGERANPPILELASGFSMRDVQSTAKTMLLEIETNALPATSADRSSPKTTTNGRNQIEEPEAPASRRQPRAAPNPNPGLHPEPTSISIAMASRQKDEIHSVSVTVSWSETQPNQRRLGYG
ncbi:Unknown protein [Striga hermonthica]|uniref:Transferase n=1 Tax=Striga hermonthica TaxID=68872 RepID=A0A9N7RDT3_STRHE|nr:Unknown protein [Striga hermonthica]